MNYDDNLKQRIESASRAARGISPPRQQVFLFSFFCEKVKNALHR